MSSVKINRLIELRHKIHQYPELSGQEIQTAKTVTEFLKTIGVKEIKTGIAGNGILAVIEGTETGKSILFRCELDALPINEENDLNYSSNRPGKAHLCGHDGHIVILLGLAERLIKIKHLIKGRVVLLFQPAEETAQGAYQIIQDPEFKKLEIDHAIALHNIPGYPHGSIILRKHSFASASRGMIIKLKGQTSHAGEPHNGKPPTLAMTGIIDHLIGLPNMVIPYSNRSMVTVISAKLGEKAFGTSPGYAEIMATLRAGSAKDITTLISKAEKAVDCFCSLSDLKSDITYTEVFPVTINDNDLTEKVKKAALKLNRQVIWLDIPFSWSEDFGYFSQEIPSVFFGLGSGLDQPKLHNPDYDFPDDIIDSGIEIFYKIYSELL